jgi:hypothetical protein
VVKNKSIKLKNIDKEKVDSMVDQIKLLRAYFTGWSDAGKMLPPGHEVLWQLHIALREAE